MGRVLIVARRLSFNSHRKSLPASLLGASRGLELANRFFSAFCPALEASSWGQAQREQVISGWSKNHWANSFSDRIIKPQFGDDQKGTTPGSPAKTATTPMAFNGLHRRAALALFEAPLRPRFASVRLDGYLDPVLFCLVHVVSRGALEMRAL